MLQNLIDFFSTTGFSQITGPMLIMWVIAGILLWLAVAKGFEPLLLVPIAFGAVIANLPTRGIITVAETSPGVYESATFNIEAQVETHAPAEGEHLTTQTLHVTRMEGGLFDFISQGIKLELIPPIIFLGVGALTDFGPLIAMPRTLLLGAAAQAGWTAFAPGPGRPTRRLAWRGARGWCRRCPGTESGGGAAPRPHNGRHRVQQAGSGRRRRASRRVVGLHIP